jgi:hypothetical protein
VSSRGANNNVSVPVKRRQKSVPLGGCFRGPFHRTPTSAKRPQILSLDLHSLLLPSRPLPHDSLRPFGPDVEPAERRSIEDDSPESPKVVEQLSEQEAPQATPSQSREKTIPWKTKEETTTAARSGNNSEVLGDRHEGRYSLTSTTFARRHETPPKDL